MSVTRPFLRGVASVLLRVAKWLSAPGAGPKLVVS
jgi:hypothetical protein